MGMLELVNSVAIAIILIISVVSIYLTRLRGPKIKAIEVQKQTPLSSAYHTVIFTNYGNKTGVVIGPEIKSRDEKMKVTETGNNESSVIAVEPQGTVISEIEVYSNTNADTDYHLEYVDQRGRVIRLPVHTFIGEAKKKPSD